MKIGIAQIAPVFMNRTATVEKSARWVGQAAEKGCQLVAFGETLVPAYPFWVSKTDGARFNAPDQKRWHAWYLEQAVCIEEGHLDSLRNAARKAGVAVIVGVAERPLDRGGHSIYCTRVFIDGQGEVVSTHRKLMPTYEERLSWGMGDGAGLVTHRVGPFTVGALNCWENWMPLARAALYEAGEDLHVMLWPGADVLTREITRFAAMEGRSFVVSAGVLLREQDLPLDLPAREKLTKPGEIIYNGGSCIAGPDGRWIVEPVVGKEELIVAELDPARVYEERQNFDPAGHYARPDVLELTVNRRRGKSTIA